MLKLRQSMIDFFLIYYSSHYLIVITISDMERLSELALSVEEMRLVNLGILRNTIVPSTFGYFPDNDSLLAVLRDAIEIFGKVI